MGVKDTVTNKYMRQNHVFADAFNYFVYDGEQMIDPDSLEELDTREIEVPYGGADGAEQPVQRIRDVIKSVTAMTDKKSAYLILAVESQSNVHYAMPVKNLVMDALQYARQVEKAIASHKLSGDYKSAGGDEFLSGFMKEDKLIPVVTLVIYFGAKVWDGPMTVHEMFEEQDTRLLSLVPDYRMNLIAPASIEDGDFEKFRSTLKEVLAFIKYSRDKDKLRELVETDEVFHHIGRDEVDILNACVGANLRMERDEEVLDVCEAIQGIAAEAAAEERIATLATTIKTIMEKMGMTAEQSMAFLEVSENDCKMITPLL